MKYLLAIVLCLIPAAVWADMSIEFLRILCIPESRFFEVEYREVPSDAVYFNYDDSQQQFKAWKKKGYYVPDNVRYECKLPDSTYVMTSSRPPATERDLSPMIRISLSRNGEKWMDNVPIGSHCCGGPFITRISIRDGKKGWDTRNADICISPSTGSSELCEFLSETYGHISMVMPLTEAELEEYDDQNFNKERVKSREQVANRRPSLVDFKREVCAFPDLKLPPDTVIYAIGGYGNQCRPYGHQIDQSGHDARILT